MNDEIRRLIEHIQLQPADVKQRIFDAIQSEVVVHPLQLDAEFMIDAYTILEAIRRSSPLIRRGVRGVIGETVFSLYVAPHEPVWKPMSFEGDQAYDELLTNGRTAVRVQVKMQRRDGFEPKLYRGGYVVEVQRTRTGTSDAGGSTRPYRIDEFDILAVCMQPSTRDWRNFLYAPVKRLAVKEISPHEIATMQVLPEYPALGHGVWTSDLTEAINRQLS